METYIAILRGINVSGKKLIKMEELRIHLQDIKLKDVKTYIQSGNIVFNYPTTNQKELATLISDKIKKEYGFDVPVIVLNQLELKYISENNPFINERNEDTSKLAVTFLSEEADADKSIALYTLNDSPNEFIIVGKVIYLLCPNGFSNSKLTINFIENKLKLTASSRNWNTVVKLLGMASTYS
jgi:uncharacterized protein (DUF1697 family)